MIIILIILFVFVGAWRKREVINNANEIEYFERVNLLVKQAKSVDEIYSELKELLQKYFHSTDESFIKQKLEADLKILGVQE